MEMFNPGKAVLFLLSLLALWIWDDVRTDYYRTLGKQEIIEVQREEALLAQQAAQTKERQWQLQTQKAQDDANQRVKKLQADAAAAKSAADSLRHEVRATRRQLSEATRPTIIEYGSVASELLAECSERYSNVAKQADGYASDRQTLIESWPK